MEIVDIELPYGRDGVFQARVPGSLLAAYHRGPQAVEGLAQRLDAALASPMDFPALRQAVLPGDRIVLALDRGTPDAATLIAGVWKVLASQAVDPQDVLILQPAAIGIGAAPDPRQLLPEDVRERIRWVRHDATSKDEQFAYLAATSSGERVYLAREIIDADFVLSIGTICFDSVLGHRGTSSVLYPGLSRSDTIGRAHGLGHDELGPGDERSLRQTIDEVGWLLGVQFAVQVIPAVGGSAAEVFAGSLESVFRRGTERLDERWRIRTEERVDFVVVAVEGDEAGHDWRQIGAALDNARRLVCREGRILVLSQLNAPLTPGLELLQSSRTPRDALKPLREAAPEDLVAATQIAKAADWARVYLLSDLDDETVEGLFAMPLDTAEQAQRLIEGEERMAFVGSAQHVFASVQD
jgi:nickel-dependent lactate racemase